MRRLRLVFGLLAAGALALACARHTPITPWVVPAEVPERYRPLYQELDVLLHRRLPLIAPLRWSGRADGPAFGLELPIDPGGGGLSEEALSEARLMLERFPALAVRAVALRIPYGLLADGGPPEARRALGRLAAEVRGRGLRLAVRLAAEDFGAPPAERVPAAGIAAGRKRLNLALRAAVAAVLADLQPDHLTVLCGPMELGRATGLPVAPSDYAAAVAAAVADLDHPGVRLGAGAGSWEAVDYFKELAGVAELDYLEVGLRSVQYGFAHERILKAAELARSTGKGVVIGEAWLAKTTSRESGRLDPAAALARDGFAFWSTLDRHFIDLTTELARELGAELCLFSGARALFGSLEYRAELEELSPAELVAAGRRAAREGLRQGALTPTGEHLRARIGG